MKCPTDGATLSITDRSGIEIDFCPECRGVWLDRGELDKLIERAGNEFRPSSSSAPTRDSDFERSQRSGRDDDDDRGRQKKRKKGSFLGEMFEF